VRNPGETRARLKKQILGAQYERSSLQMKLDALKRVVDEKTAALKTLRSKLAEAVIRAALYEEERAEYQAELDQCREQLCELEELLARRISVEDRLHKAEQFLTGLAPREEWTQEEKRQMMELLVADIALGPDGIKINYTIGAADSAVFTPTARGNRARRSSAPRRTAPC
jgi:uncharacterized coiled-coil DUF342 family protein